MIGIYIYLILCFVTSVDAGCDVGYWGPSCTTKCAGGCSNACNSTTGECSCNDGYFGIKCDSQCGYNCNGTCNKFTGYCECKDGFYTHEYNRHPEDMCIFSCSIGCPELCDKYNGTCPVDCKDGYWGDECSQYCASGCEGACDRVHGYCKSECKDGYYGSSCYSCGRGCPGPCNKTDRSCPYECIHGYHGVDCHSKCYGGCPVECDDNGNCPVECIDGYYGSQCRLTCFKGCEAMCRNTDGKCPVECTDGWYGLTCSGVCPGGCPVACNKLTGRCPVQCKDGYYRDDCAPCGTGCINTCNKTDGSCTCSFGYWGETCWNICDKKCLVGCDHLTGRCLENTCENNNCVQGLCFNKTGECIYGCKQPFNGPTCDKCAPGYYGVHCNLTCPGSCVFNECFGITGECLLGCKPRFSGVRCDQCAVGYFGIDVHGEVSCNNSCSKECADNTCDPQTGFCVNGCKSYYRYGTFCNKRCPDTCSTDVNKLPYCNDSGTCIGKCVKGFFGHDCLSECNDKCVNYSCDKISGECLNGCIAGFQNAGPTCSVGPNSKNELSTSSNVAIVSSVVGAVAFFGIIGLVLLFVLKRRKTLAHVNTPSVKFEEGTSVYENGAPTVSDAAQPDAHVYTILGARSDNVTYYESLQH